MSSVRLRSQTDKVAATGNMEFEPLNTIPITHIALSTLDNWL